MSVTLVIHHANEISMADQLSPIAPLPTPKLKVRFRVRVTLDNVPPTPKYFVHSLIEATLATFCSFDDQSCIGQHWTRYPLQNEKLDLELQQHFE